VQGAYGDVDIARLDAQGNLISVARTNIPVPSYGGRAVLAPDGSAFVYSSFNDSTITRLNPDGSRDTTFGSDGVVTVTFQGLNQGQQRARLFDRRRPRHNFQRDFR